MSKSPFLVLGISDNATQAEVETAYRKLRDKYRLDMHQEGEKGKFAANKLSEVETAYKAVKVILDSKVNYDGNIYSTIEQLVKANNFEEAQKTLDGISERGAEWHYYQSAIYYKKGWLMEARSQLNLAVTMDPRNDKYVNALQKLEDKLSNRGSAESAQQSGSAQGAKSGYQRSYQSSATRDDTSDNCCACCQGLICANCLCDCMQCCR
ncbi:MAG: hypothetical protein EOM87_03785 [Clostridia bacterium]|nr:hypothetical protein [Clostridia bacterium]